MLVTLAVNLLAAATMTYQTDTTVVVRPNMRLMLKNFGGDIAVRAWDRNAVHVQASHSHREKVDIISGVRVLAVEARSRRGPPGSVDFVLTVPRSMAVDLAGVYSSASLSGLRGDVSVNTVNGEISVRGGSGQLSLTSVMGAIKVLDARGRLHVNTVNGEINLEEIAGKIYAESVNGSIALARVLSDSVEATSVNGSLCYDGSVRGGGWYRFATHNGSIAVGLPERVGATVSVATFQGNFQSGFPLKLVEGGKKRFRFALGDGKAQIELESFQGRIMLRRPGQGWKKGQPPCVEDDTDNDNDNDNDNNQDEDSDE